MRLWLVFGLFVGVLSNFHVLFEIDYEQSSETFHRLNVVTERGYPTLNVDLEYDTARLGVATDQKDLPTLLPLFLTDLRDALCPLQPIDIMATGKINVTYLPVSSLVAEVQVHPGIAKAIHAAFRKHGLERDINPKGKVILAATEAPTDEPTNSSFTEHIRSPAYLIRLNGKISVTHCSVHGVCRTHRVDSYSCPKPVKAEPTEHPTPSTLLPTESTHIPSTISTSDSFDYPEDIEVHSLSLLPNEHLSEEEEEEPSSATHFNSLLMFSTVVALILAH